MQSKHSTYERTLRSVWYAGALLSLVAALIHAWVMPEHMAEWWVYGTFFLTLTVAQGLYAAPLLRWPQPRVFFLSIGGNLAVILLCVAAQTVGVSLLGHDHLGHNHHAGEAGRLMSLGLASKLVEMALITALVVLWRATQAPRTPVAEG